MGRHARNRWDVVLTFAALAAATQVLWLTPAFALLALALLAGLPFARRLRWDDAEPRPRMAVAAEARE